MSARGGKISTIFAAAAIANTVALTASCLSTSGLTGGGGSDGSVAADGDIDDPRNNPCGANLRTDKVNCGRCGHVCPTNANGYPECHEGTCVTECHTGFGDCDGDNDNGCESELAANPLHCGRCARNCSGGECSANQCQPVVATNVTGRATGVAVDGEYVYFAFNGTAANSSGIARIAKGEASPTPVPVVQGQPPIQQITLDEGYVYWTTRSSDTGGGTPDGGVYRIKKDGSEGVKPVATGLHTRAEAVVRVFEGTAYFTVQGYYDVGEVSDVESAIASCPVAGCSPTTNVRIVASGTNIVRPLALALDGRNLYFSTAGSTPGTPVPPAVYECSLANGVCAAAPAFLQSNTRDVFSIELDANHVYFATGTEVSSVDRATKKVTSLAAGLRRPRSLAVDATHVHWVTSDSQGTVQSCAIEGCGGVPRTVASALAYPHSVVSDASAIYWSLEGAFQATTTSVMKVVK